MLMPTKYEDLENNLMVLGVDVIKKLKNNKSHDIESLFQAIKTSKSINLERFYNTLCFLWLSEIIILDGISIRLK